MIALIDYYAGNLRSIENAFQKLGTSLELTKKPSDLENADAVILPGVGNFGDAMKELEKYRDVIQKQVQAGKPFLGLCLGIQVIMESSEEAPGVNGLGLIKGTCRKFPDTSKVPHMGWNTINVNKENPLLKDLDKDSHYYFVHSYYPEPEDKNVIAASTEYGLEFPSVIVKDNLMATQFHPEKSSSAGLKILQNFLDLI